MRELDSFGGLLRSFRTRLGAPQHDVVWLARQLGYPTSTIYGWETGDSSKGLPPRSTILNIGRFYGLTPDEVNWLISACGAEKKQRAHAVRYAPLSPDESSEWTPLYGPSSRSLRVWSEQLRAAQDAYRIGELRSSRKLAESLLLQISSSTEGDVAVDLWSCDERDELARLWILAWREFFESSALLESATSIAPACKPFLGRARFIATRVGDPRIKALAIHLEGDYYHNQALHGKALDYHFQAARALGEAQADPGLAAMIQRLIILDGMHVLTREQLQEQLQRGKRMVEWLAPSDTSARVLLSESIGRTLGVLGNADCWIFLRDAETEGREKFPAGHITALYSRMLALATPASAGDHDQLRMLASFALAVATHSGWKRRVNQVMQLATDNGVALSSLV